jgi:4-hydroxy-4-methyl-2-oxoglutarate aldolase
LCRTWARPLVAAKQLAPRDEPHVCLWCQLYYDANGEYPSRQNKVFGEKRVENEIAQVRPFVPRRRPRRPAPRLPPSQTFAAADEEDVDEPAPKRIRGETATPRAAAHSHPHQAHQHQHLPPSGSKVRRTLPVAAEGPGTGSRPRSGAQSSQDTARHHHHHHPPHNQQQQHQHQHQQHPASNGSGNGRNGDRAPGVAKALEPQDQDGVDRLLNLYMSEDRVLAPPTLDAMLVQPGNPEAELIACPTTRLADAMQLLGIPLPAGTIVMQSPSWAYYPAARMVGRAHTVTLGGSGLPDYSVQHPDQHERSFVDAIPRGSVVVISCPETLRGRGSAWEVVDSLRARALGARGVVLDGLVRDVELHRGEGFFVFSRGRTVSTASRALSVVSTKTPVTVDGVLVCSGDWIVADTDGIVVVPRQRLDEVLAVAKEIQRDTERIAELLRAGVSLYDAKCETQFRF